MSGLSRWPMLGPFRVRGFRFQWPADLLTSCAFEMEMLILGWYVLVETGSVLLLTLFGSLHFFGTVIAPMIGVIGDRVGLRGLLVAMRAIYTILAAALMALALTDQLSPFAVFAIATAMALVRTSDIGVRTALVADLMPPDLLTRAVGIARTTSDGARIAGALTGAGLFAAFGIGPAYVVIAAFYATGLLLTLGAKGGRSSLQSRDAPTAAKRKSPWRDMGEGLVYVWSTPHLLAAMWLAVLVNLTAFPITGGLMPYVAREIYQVDKTGLGYLVAGWATGALVGSLTVSLLAPRLRLGRMMLYGAAAWHLVLLAFAQLTSATSGTALLAVAGFAQSLSMVCLAVMLLRTSEIEFRGRVMGVRMLSTYSLPFGLLGLGALIERIGFAATASLSAALGVALTIAIGVYWRACLWPSDAPANRR